jgi:DNA-binding transcriptional LysR family regulator
MELRHLRYFRAVAEEGHVTRAAERLGIQQPPLSQQIKALETELNVRLFRRKPRGVDLTEAGRALFDSVRDIFDRLDRAGERARRAARGELGELSIGISSTAHFCPLVPRIVRAFRDTFPGVAIRLREGGTGDLIAQTEDGRVDLAFVRRLIAPMRELSALHLLDEPMIAAVPAGHRLNRPRHGGRAIPLKALAAETFVLYRSPEGPGLTEAIIAACDSAGFTPRLGQEAPRPASALNFVAAGHGVTVVPQSLQRMQLDGVAYHRLTGMDFRAPLNLIRRKGDAAPVVLRFLKVAQAAVREGGSRIS